MQKDSLLIQRSTGLPEEVARRLRDQIERGEFKRGEQLPSQQELTEIFGVSRPVLREAISLLKSEGLVISHQGRGLFINPEGSSVFHLNPNFEDRGDLVQLLELLKSFEVTATALAAERRTKPELARIKKALDDLEAAIGQDASGVDEDMQFHHAILEASHNHYFSKFGEFLDVRVRKLIRTARSNTARYSGLTRKVHDEHKAIYDAIAAQDAQGARAAADTHLTNATQRLKLYKMP
jgi:DNA-binding FadR family transcriptional regulator